MRPQGKHTTAMMIPKIPYFFVGSCWPDAHMLMTGPFDVKRDGKHLGKQMRTACNGTVLTVFLVGFAVHFGSMREECDDEIGWTGVEDLRGKTWGWDDLPVVLELRYAPPYICPTRNSRASSSQSTTTLDSPS